LNNNITIAGNNNPSSYLLLISTKTGSAINLGNNVNTGAGNPSSVFYTSSGTINVSNNAESSQLTGYAINLSNNATITYSTGLPNATFANGPGGSWAMVRGTYVISE
jgi:hypothetical protein